MENFTPLEMQMENFQKIVRKRRILHPYSYNNSVYYDDYYDCRVLISEINPKIFLVNTTHICALLSICDLLFDCSENVFFYACELHGWYNKFTNGLAIKFPTF